VGLERGVPTGSVKCQFDEWDKRDFVTSYCDQHEVDLSQCIAIGDSRLDIPLFREVGFSVALNASPQAREAATIALDIERLTDILDLIPATS
jgi:phosphoserine phosphatase